MTQPLHSSHPLFFFVFWIAMNCIEWFVIITSSIRMFTVNNGEIGVQIMANNGLRAGTQVPVPFETKQGINMINQRSGGRKRRPDEEDDENNQMDDDMNGMNDCMAAMVLMSLSCSPKSPGFLENGKFIDMNHQLHHQRELQKHHTQTQGQLSEQTIIKSELNSTGSTPSTNNGVYGTSINSNSNGSGRFGRESTRILYQCTWPGCGEEYLLCHQVEEHVRTKHLGRSDVSEGMQDGEEEFYYTEIEVDGEDSSSSPSASSFVPPSPSACNDESCRSCQSPSQCTHSSSFQGIGLPNGAQLSFFASSSAPTWSHLDMVKPPHEDPEYQKMKMQNISDLYKQQRLNISRHGPHQHIYSSSPINIPGAASGIAHHSASAPNTFGSSAGNGSVSSSTSSTTSAKKSQRITSKGHNHLGTTLLSHANCYQCNKTSSGSSSNGGNSTSNGTTSSSPHKRGRGESRKCRKVYGMENRDLWCTQCKWKKACTRFTD